MALSSCTAALHLAVLACGGRPGDEVIVPSFTFAATANVAELAGARAVFCDIDTATFTMDPASFEERITGRTRAVIPVHLFGMAADMDPIVSTAHRHGLRIVEDAACAFGTLYRGRHAGMFGDCGAFSLHPRKSLTTGEGGMLVTDSGEIHDLVASLCNHGSDNATSSLPHAMPDIVRPGLNYRLTDIQAALGICQIEDADAIISARKAAAARYDRLLQGIPWLRTPGGRDHAVHSYQAYVCMFEPEPVTPANVMRTSSLRNAFMEHLALNGISTRPGTHAVHTLKYYREKYGISPEDCPNSWIAAECSVALPLYPGLTAADMDYVVDAVSEFGRKHLS